MKTETTTIRIDPILYKKVRQKLMVDDVTVSAFLQAVFKMYLDGSLNFNKPGDK